MRYYDFFIITNEHVLAKVENQEWKIFEYRDHYPAKMPRDLVDIFDEPEVFFHAIKSIMKLTRKPFWKRSLIKNHLALFAIDELNSKLRKRLFEEAFYQVNYLTIFHLDIGPTAVMVGDKEGYNTPTVVVSVIGQVIELSFCFGGAVITKQYIRESLRAKFEDFIKTCKNLQSTDLSNYIDTTDIDMSAFEITNHVWQEKRNIKVIIVSNNNSFDYWADREINYDHKVNFTQIADLVTNISWDKKSKGYK